MHTGIAIQTLSVKLASSDQVFEKNITDPISLDNLEYIGQRNVFSVYFNGLSADTTYNVTITDLDEQRILK